MDFETLRRRTAEVDEQHRAAMSTIHDDLTAVHFGEADAAATVARRRFLQRAAAGAAIVVGGTVVPLGALAAAAQESGTEGGTTGDTVDPAAEGPTPISATEEGPTPISAVEAEPLEPNPDCATAPIDAPEADAEVVRFAESVERAAVAAYGLAVASGKLSAQVLESARTFARHHADHANALYCLVPNPAPMAANQALVDAIAPQVQGAADADALITVLYQLEESAAATYAFALGVLESADVAGAAASILPVESQHAVVWGETLDLPIDQWMPSFQSEAGALDPAEYAS